MLWKNYTSFSRGLSTLLTCRGVLSGRYLVSLIYPMTRNGAPTIHTFWSAPFLSTTFSGKSFAYSRKVSEVTCITLRDISSSCVVFWFSRHRLESHDSTSQPSPWQSFEQHSNVAQKNQDVELSIYSQWFFELTFRAVKALPYPCRRKDRSTSLTIAFSGTCQPFSNNVAFFCICPRKCIIYTENGCTEWSPASTVRLSTMILDARAAISFTNIFLASTHS